MSNIYRVKFEYRGRVWEENFAATGFAPAFAKCVKKYGEVELINATVVGRGIARGMSMTCKAPSLVKLEPEPKLKEQQTEMPLETDN